MSSLSKAAISRKIFEIQYSPISLEEAMQRCEDYESLGYHIIWILHADTFEQEKVGAAERFLRTKTCYYSDMDADGNGHIYDRFDLIHGKTRVDFSDMVQIVDLRKCFSVPQFNWPKELVDRGKTWPLYHEGDYLDSALKNQLAKIPIPHTFFETVKDTYLGILHMLLERSVK